MLPVGHNKLYIMKDLGQSYLNMSQNKSSFLNEWSLVKKPVYMRGNLHATLFDKNCRMLAS